MKKLLCLCLTGVLIYIATAQARVDFIASESAFSRRSPSNVRCTPPLRNIGGRCIGVCDPAKYPLTQEPDQTKGVPGESCTGNVYQPRYSYASCHEDKGYEWNATKTDCVIRDCSGYPLQENEMEDIGEPECCLSGAKKTCKYLSCKDGWTLENGKCILNNCNAFPYPESRNQLPDRNIGPFEECTTGFLTYFRYTSCTNSDYTFVAGGYCNRTCGSYHYTAANMPSGCTKVGSCIDINGIEHFNCSRSNPDQSANNDSDSAPSLSRGVPQDDALLADLLVKFRKIINFPAGGVTENHLRDLYNTAKSESKTLRSKSNFPLTLDYFEGGTNDVALANEAMASWLFAMTLAEVDPTKRNELYKVGYVVDGKKEATFGRDFDSDLNVSRLVAATIYAKHHDFDKAEQMRKEVGSSKIKINTSDGKHPHKEVYVDLQSFMPQAPGPYDSEYSNRNDTAHYNCFDEKGKELSCKVGGYPVDANKEIAYNTDWDLKIHKYILDNYNFPRQEAIQATADKHVNKEHFFGETQMVTDPTYGKMTVNPTFGKHNIGVTIDPNGKLYDTLYFISAACSESREALLYPQYGRTRPGLSGNGYFLYNDYIENGNTELDQYPSSYPSGHSAFGWCAGMVLTELLPDKAANIMKAANSFAVNRTIARYHWTSDTIRGRVIGSSFIPVLYAVSNYDFEEDFEDIKDELGDDSSDTRGVDPTPDPTPTPNPTPDPTPTPDPEPTALEICQQGCGSQYVNKTDKVCVNTSNDITGITENKNNSLKENWTCIWYIAPQELCQRGCGASYSYNGGKLCKDAANENNGTSKTKNNTSNSAWTCQWYEAPVEEQPVEEPEEVDNREQCPEDLSGFSRILRNDCDVYHICYKGKIPYYKCVNNKLDPNVVEEDSRYKPGGGSRNTSGHVDAQALEGRAIDDMSMIGRD